MSYTVSGVATISFPIPALQNDSYSVPGSHRALPAVTPDTRSSNSSPASSDVQVHSIAPSTKAVEVKRALPVDTVTLSTSQQVLKLQREGESTLQIAATLNLPTKEVESDLRLNTHVAQSFTVAPITTPLSGNTTATVSVPTIGA